MNSAKPNSPFAAAVDAITLNYQGEVIRDSPTFADFRGIRTPPQYPAFRERFPGKAILSSESAAAYSSRGTYGPGEIVATDNGDPTSFERFPAPERNAFNGPALVVVRTLAGRPGTIRVSAQSGTLPRCRAHRSRYKASPRPGKQRYSLQRYPEAQARLQH
jgi:hypothetical protein